MSRYMIICRLRWPAFLLLTGVIALLHQANILRWNRAWPLYLILWGVLALAERATLASEQPTETGYPYGAGYPAAGYQAAGFAGQPGGYAGGTPVAAPTAPATPTSVSSTGIVPVHNGLEVRDDFSGSKEEEGR